MFLDIIHRLFYLKTQRFGDWILLPSSGKTYSVGPIDRAGMEISSSANHWLWHSA
jgi:hypothetical protein